LEHFRGRKRSFDFVIVAMGVDPYADRIKRLQKERELIQQHKDNCYNLLSLVPIPKINPITNQSLNSIAVIAYNVEYPSINAAARAHGISTATARNLLNDQNNKDWVFADINRSLISNTSRAVVVKNTYYPSVSLAAANEGVSEKTVRRNIKTNPDWHYFDTLSAEQKNEINNLPRAKQEINPVGAFAHGRKVQVDDKVYLSIKEVSRIFKIDPRSVYKRIDSKKTQFKDWKWFSEAEE
jgi:hypothetical protein